MCEVELLFMVAVSWPGLDHDCASASCRDPTLPAVQALAYLVSSTSTMAWKYLNQEILRAEGPVA